jgi:hypothetical protein
MLGDKLKSPQLPRVNSIVEISSTIPNFFEFVSQTLLFVK